MSDNLRTFDRSAVDDRFVTPGMQENITVPTVTTRRICKSQLV
jgi:hypothetical protein